MIKRATIIPRVINKALNQYILLILLAVLRLKIKKKLVSILSMLRTKICNKE